MLELRQSVRGRIAAEMCLFDLCRVEGSTLAALTARVEKLEAMLAGRIPAIQQTVPAAPVHQDYPKQAAAAPETGPKFGYVLDEGHGIHTEAPEPQPQKAAAEAENYQPAAEPVKAVPVKKAAPVQNAEPAPIMEADAAAGDLWQQVLEILKTEKKRSMVACAAGGRAVSYVNGILTVAFKNKFNCKRMNADDYKKAFEAVLLRLARCEVRLNCVEEAGLVQKTPAPAPAKEQEEELEPVVKKAMAAFGGTLQKL